MTIVTGRVLRWAGSRREARELVRALICWVIDHDYRTRYAGVFSVRCARCKAGER